MEQQKERLAMVSIPVQQGSKLYDFSEALREGTIFPELNLPFYLADSVPKTIDGKPDHRDPGGVQENREQLMQKICEISFVLDDLTLYLDTHCDDRQALKILEESSRLRQDLIKEFANRYYPLTRDCMAKSSCETFCEHAGENVFAWEKGPMPWEGACI